MLVAASVLNAAFVYTRTRTYSLTNRPLDKVPDTPSRRKVVYTEPTYDPTEPGSATASPVKKVLQSLLSSKSSTSSAENNANADEIWVLDTWDPPLFNLSLAALYSPLAVLLLWFGPVSFFSLAVLLPALAYTLHTVTNLFLVAQRDKTVLHAEVLSEYEQTVVRPVVSAARRDVSVGVDGSVAYYAPGLNHHFRTTAPRHSSAAVAGPGTPAKIDISRHSFPLASPVFPSKPPSDSPVGSSPFPHRLQYNAAGYYTPAAEAPQTSPSRRESSTEYQNSPLSRKRGGSSLFRRLHK